MLAKARLFAFTFALAFLTISVASAQELSDSAREALATELYGEGVHAYYDGKYEEAAEALDRALALKTTDPRVHYFRGLTAFAQGQIPEAREDFLKGARMELSGPPQFYPVARSLERV